MDFYKIKEKSSKNGVIEVYPDFRVCRSKDLMIRGKSFYAIWDEESGLWSTDEYDVQRIVDKDILKYKDELEVKTEARVIPKLMGDFSTKTWADFRSYLNHLSDNSTQLDERLIFSNTKIKKTDYASKRLNYPLVSGSIEAYEELMNTLYDKEEREKLEWAIGSIIAGDSKKIQKFVVLYGEGGTGKSTVLNIIQKLFNGYYATFEAKALTSNNNSFATEAFKTNPLVAIQHDGDLSKIEDNTRLNSIISHEEMVVNEKYKPSYMSKFNCFLFIGTNKPVRITDAKSGLIRRLIDVSPTGNKVSPKLYQTLISQIDFELGAIASYCLDVYRKLGKNYYSSYKPISMMLQTDVFYNFVDANYHTFKEQDGVSLSQAYAMYKEYCEDALIDYKTPRHKFREELKNYFKKFYDITRVGGAQIRSYFSEFITDKLNTKVEEKEEQLSLSLDSEESLLDVYLKDASAQYASEKETPMFKWDNVKTKLLDLDTNRLHYVKPEVNHIVIDFDLKDEKGKKSKLKNLEAASKWPPTYAEYSKGGNGVHLHYIYDGDASKLTRLYSEDIEVKVFVGNSSLRRKKTKCNNVPIATISSGIPMKGEKMINLDVVKNEKGLRRLIKKNLKKEIHPGTKPSIDFIHKILEDAYDSDMIYDVKDLRPAVLSFANNSSNQAEYCVKLVSEMKFESEKQNEDYVEEYEEDQLIFFDVEVFPNLFVLVWKAQGKTPVKMINPEPHEIEKLLKMKLVGFNCRRYDNHILYARFMGYNNQQLYNLSQRIISGSPNAMFMEAYNLSYTDIYDFSSKKQSLKKFEIELGIHHKELGLPWDKPVPKEKWVEVADYCVNDVVATEETFKARKADYTARLILSKLSGLSPNSTTQNHTAKIIFGDDKKPQEKFIYTDLSKEFPGYKYENGKSIYKGEDPSEGGYVWAVPGMYSNVGLLDITSLHPTSTIVMNMFGPYTKRYKELLDARVSIKRKDFETAKKMLNGVLEPFLKNTEDSEDLAYALKIVINIVYGLTSAKFENKFKDPRNVDNIVAKRGALFMIDLKHACLERGFDVVHIKTDSIKIANISQEAIDFVMEFGRKYGYNFEHEATYSKMCLVNDAVYIAKDSRDNHWTATGAQFAHPYVFKKLFSNEDITLDDLVEVKSVTSALYLDMNEDLIDEKHNFKFVGKVGAFVPIKPGFGGGVLLREKENKYYAATGSKGYRWLEAEYVKNLNKEQDIDYSYFEALINAAINNISKFGDFEWFRN